MTQAWTKSGKRIPVTVLKADDCMVVGKASTEGKIQIGGSVKKLKNMHKPQRASLEKAGVSVGFRKVCEVTASDADLTLAIGTKIAPQQVLSLGDIVKVTGTSKGSGFTGVVKRHGFKGGSRTHGQADRERAPGSIGAGTTPGRVYKNKRMAGRAGNERVTVEGLQVVALNEQTGEVWVKGLVPGAMNGIVLITKVESTSFDGLLSTDAVKAMEAPVAQPTTEEAPVAEEDTTTVEPTDAPVTSEVQPE